MNNNTVPGTEILELTESSKQAKKEYDETVISLEIQKRANSLSVDIVPTLPSDIKQALRNINEPIHIFGENRANIRDRLRYCIAKHIVLLERRSGESFVTTKDEEKQKQQDEVKSTTYTHASKELINARKYICNYSFINAKYRLCRERKRRTTTATSAILSKNDNTDEDSILNLNNRCNKFYSLLSNTSLYGSQYAGKGRILSSVKAFPQDGDADSSRHIITSGWSSILELWDISSNSEINLLTDYPMAHEDRIMSMDVFNSNDDNNKKFVATASIDTNAKLFSISSSSSSSNNSGDNNDNHNIQEEAIYTGHKARLSRIAIHPSNKYIGTTSFDHTWRLWDIQTSQELLLQDSGHIRETFGIDFHKDGSLVSISDLASVIQLWDLRCGKSICNFIGHAKRVLNTKWSNNGFQLFSSGDDGTIKVWDVRQRKLVTTISAHSHIISNMVVDTPNSETIVTCSFDGLIKVWSARDWSLLSVLKGHDGKVNCVDIVNCKDINHTSIVSVGYDKTVKIWK